MSIDHIVDPHQRLITVTLSGVVTGRMLSELQHHLRNDPLIESGFNEVIDFGQMQCLDFETSLWEFGDLVIPESVDPTQCRIALLPAERQDARILKDRITRQRRPQADVRVFDEMEDALAWVNGEVE
jgi:hypothetical protein